MGYKKLPNLTIGDIVINPPIIQGGMGVAVSKALLASSVSNNGALGVIASVGLGKEKKSEEDYIRDSREALINEIKKAKNLTKNPIGVNIMVALSNYEDLVHASVNNGVEVIITGAGLPLKLPAYIDDSRTKLIPIISSGRAAKIICDYWRKKFNRLPDAIIVEGPLAGGHLGFNREELNKINDYKIDKLLLEVLNVIKDYELPKAKKIPVIVAGGIYDGRDIAKMIKLGASGVQIATRFVCTYECDVSEEYKKTFLKARKEDITIIDSPVGLPGRVIRNKFIDRVLKGEKISFRCPYRCLKSCDSGKVNYCIADALINASKGDFENGFAMCGANAYRIDKVISVKELIDELVKEALTELK